MHRFLGALLAIVFVSSTAWSESPPDPGQVIEVVEPGPSPTVFLPGSDPELDDHLRVHDRMFYGIHAFPFGIGLTTGAKDGAALDLIRDWLDQEDELDLEAFTGKHPYELQGGYEGPNLGLRGGGASPGTAFRYMALRQEGAPAADLARARADVVKALEYLPVINIITGIPFGIARGAMLLKSKNENEPPFPGGTPTLVPLFDEEGNPLPPGEKNNGTSRPDNSGGILPEGLWYWEDSCSKDQLVGWVAAMATLYDAAVGDPSIDPALVEALREMACAVGAGLRQKVPFTALDGETYDYDLVIMDADGRPTKHHDLNPLALEGMYLPPESTIYNVFNLLMGLGIVKGLYHVCGDEASEAFLYQELLGMRDYLDMVPRKDDKDALDYVYMGPKTNFSNVNMIAIALFLNVWYESDAEVNEGMLDFVENRWWDVPGVIQSARHLKQPYFDALYQAMTDRGTDGDRAKTTAALLKAFTLDPYTGADRINCADDELAAGECLAVDGATTLTLQKDTNRGGHPIATEALNPSIRPPSNFDARSDPFSVNGGGGDLGLNPGGDLHAAYWILRYLPVLEPGLAARSPHARNHMPVGGPVAQPDDESSSNDVPLPVAETGIAETGSQDAGIPDSGLDSGGGCTVSRGGPAPVDTSAGLVVLWFALLAAIGACSRLRTERTPTMFY